MENIKWTDEDTVGRILPDGKIEKEFEGQGYIYKNYRAFFEKTDEVCYVPEYSTSSVEDKETVDDDSKYTYKDFVRIAQKFIDENEDVQEYCKEEELTAEDIAQDIFETIDWQSPETLIVDWEMCGAYTE